MQGIEMKEIDFIPSWYHEDRKRRSWYFHRYVTVLVITGIWMLWNLVLGGMLSRTYADLDSFRVSYETGLQKIDQARQLEGRLDTLTRQDRMLEQLCPRTDISPVLAELSSRIGDRIVVTELSLIQTPLRDLDGPRQTAAATVQLKSASGAGTDSVLKTDTVLKVVLAGVAVDGAEVAALISRLEESDYFVRVVPVYSKNQTRFETTITEFEIRCIVADFKTVG